MRPLVFYLSPGEHKSEQTDSSQSNNNGPVVPIQNPPDSQNINDAFAEHAEQDADDEAAEDTDDTRSVAAVVVVIINNICYLVCFKMSPTGYGHSNMSFC